MAKPSKGTPKDKRLKENKPQGGKRTYNPDPKPSQRKGTKRK